MTMTNYTTDGVKFLKTLAKGGKGTVTLSALDAVLTEEFGWRVTAPVARAPVTRHIEYDIATRLEKKIGSHVLITSEGKTTHIWMRHQDGFKSLVKDANTADTLMDMLYVAGATEPYSKDGWYVMDVPTGKLWYGTRVIRMETPEGAEYDNVLVLNRSGAFIDVVRTEDVKTWKFFYANGLQEKAQDVVAGLKPAPGIKIRTLENTGTCPVCFRNVKLAHGRIVPHGYVLTKYFFGRSDNCAGVGYEPWEVSPDGLIKHIKGLKGLVDRWEKEVDFLSTSPESFTVHKNVVTKDHKHYGRILEEAIREIQQGLKYLKKDIDTYEDNVAKWKPSELPG